MFETVSEIIGDLMTAISNCSLYSDEHGAVGEYSKRAVDKLEQVFGEDGEISLTILGDSVFVNEKKFPGKGNHIIGFIKRVRRKGMEKLVFRKGVTPEEVAYLVSDLVNAASVPKSTDHIAIGVIEVRQKSRGTGVPGSLIDAEIDMVMEINDGLTRFGKLDMVGVEDVVASFITTIKREENVLNVVSPLKSYSKYTFTHTSNVAVLSIFQAESLGLGGEVLHEVGIAGLLHDVGKMYVPTEILEKPSKLEDHEWVEMRNHTVYGARYLSALEDVPRLAVIAAFEHHMKFDGTGYPDTLRRDRSQHLIAQIVAVADFFDALRTERPYRKALEVPVIVKFMLESSGKDFNPALIDNFIRTLKEINAF